MSAALPLPLSLDDPPTRDPSIVVETRHAGYAHETLTGTCGPHVTVQDIRAGFYHPYFGGRDARVSGCRWSCTVHTD